MLQLLPLVIRWFVEFATRKIGSVCRMLRRIPGSRASWMTPRSGTGQTTLNANLYRVVDRVLRKIEVGSLVAVGRKNWKSKPTVGVVMGMQYLAYEPKFCKWRVLIGDEVRIIHQSNLFLLEETG
jgi:hypothetical protein